VVILELGMKSPKWLIAVWIEMGVFMARAFAVVLLDQTRLSKQLFRWLAVLLDLSSACVIHFQELP